jgi:hypothetical protein
MGSLRTGAANDYNLMVDGVRDSSAEDGQTVSVTTVKCGIGPVGKVVVEAVGVPILSVPRLTSYEASGGSTPLWDSVGEVIEQLECSGPLSVGDAFLVMVITDGYENSSKIWSVQRLKQKIASLQATDKWTFVFRVPKGHSASLQRVGVPAGNIMEWEQTETSLAASTTATVSGVKSYFKARASGQTNTKSFYADLSNIAPADVAGALVDVSGDFTKIHVPLGDDEREIREFCSAHVGSYEAGRAFYQLTKTEARVQDYKEVAVVDRDTGHVYSGAGARSVLGLPSYGTVRLVPKGHGSYDVFLQSSSYTRKLVGGTTVLYKR